jgi:hypothetical protein
MEPTDLPNSDSRIQSLATFGRELKEDSLNLLLNELENRPKKYSVYFKLSKQDWKDLYGPHAVHI